MKTSTFLNYIAFILFLTGIVTTGLLAFSWSFTETSFDGYLGFFIPIAMCCICFLAGVCAATASAVAVRPSWTSARTFKPMAMKNSWLAKELPPTVFGLVLFAGIGVMLAW